MASFVYNSCIYRTSLGDIDWDGHTFKALLVTSSYTPNKDTHNARSDITGEVSGTNYSTGGETIGATPARDDANDKTTITFGTAVYTNITVSGIVGMVIYRDSGTSSTDWLVAFVDFGASYSPAGQNFNGTCTSPLTFQNTT